MTTELAKRMGVEQRFTEGRTQEEWLRHLYEQSRKAIPALLPFDEFRKQGIFKQRDPEGHHVAYKAFREDPAANPLTTPSGKIEIYSAQLAEIAATWELKEEDVIDPLPIYSPGFENYDDPLAKKYPLQKVSLCLERYAAAAARGIQLLQRSLSGDASAFTAWRTQRRG